MSTHDREELAALLAADALDEAERREAEELLARDPALAAEVERYREVLAEAAPEVEPPPGLRDRILSSAGDRPGAVAAAADLDVPENGESGELRGSLDRPVSLDERRSRRFTATAVAFAAAAAVVAIFLLGVAVLVSESEPADDLQSMVARAQTDPDATSENLVSPSGQPVAELTIVDDQGFVSDISLEGTNDNQAYQVWQIVGGEPVSAGLLSPDGLATFTVADGVEAVAISREPASGSVTPTEIVAQAIV